jgi:hypothetical protein
LRRAEPDRRRRSGRNDDGPATVTATAKIPAINEESLLLLAGFKTPKLTAVMRTRHWLMGEYSVRLDAIQNPHPKNRLAKFSADGYQLGNQIHFN